MGWLQGLICNLLGLSLLSHRLNVLVPIPVLLIAWQAAWIMHSIPGCAEWVSKLVGRGGAELRRILAGRDTFGSEPQQYSALRHLSPFHCCFAPCGRIRCCRRCMLVLALAIPAWLAEGLQFISSRVVNAA